MGLIASGMLIAFKFSLDSYVESNRKVQEKVDKVYDFATSHETRIQFLEQNARDNSQAILELQLNMQKAQYWMEKGKEWQKYREELNEQE